MLNTRMKESLDMHALLKGVATRPPRYIFFFFLQIYYTSIELLSVVGM